MKFSAKCVDVKDNRVQFQPVTEGSSDFFATANGNKFDLQLDAEAPARASLEEGKVYSFDITEVVAEA